MQFAPRLHQTARGDQKINQRWQTRQTHKEWHRVRVLWQPEPGEVRCRRTTNKLAAAMGCRSLLTSLKNTHWQPGMTMGSTAEKEERKVISPSSKTNSANWVFRHSALEGISLSGKWSGGTVVGRNAPGRTFRVHSVEKHCSGHLRGILVPFHSTHNCQWPVRKGHWGSACQLPKWGRFCVKSHFLVGRLSQSRAEQRGVGSALFFGWLCESGTQSLVCCPQKDKKIKK